MKESYFLQHGGPFIIAEMSGNHNGSLEKALQIIDAVAATGATAMKIQTYTADTMTLDLSHGEFFISDPNSLWKGESLYNLYKKAHTPWEWHEKIFQRCREKNLLCFSTPFDETSVDFLEGLDCPFYKVASFEITDLPLIKKIAQTGKPLIMSTGMASVAEIQEAVDTARQNGAQDIVLLKCTSSYPAVPLGTNIRSIPLMKEIFKTEVGLSDHTGGVGVSVASIGLGAMVIEKHFVLDRKEGGVDSAFSLESAEFKQLVDECHRAWQSLGEFYLGPVEQDRKSLIFRRSIYVSKDIKKGDVLSKDNIKVIRPSLGLEPKHFESCLGKRAAQDLKMGTPLRTEYLDA